MRAMSKRAKALLKKVHWGYSKVFDWYECKEFCEFVLWEAGDTATFRVYDDGRVFER